MMNYKRILLAVIAIGILLNENSDAQVISFTDFDTMSSSLPANISLNSINFDSVPSGTNIADMTTLEGITFGYDFDGVELSVESGSTTNSSPNYLGTLDAGVLQDGDNLSFEFTPANGFGLHIITRDELLDDDLVLNFAGVSTPLVGLEVQEELADGSSVYFVGAYDPSLRHGTASLTTIGGGFFLYNLDDFAMTKMLLVLGDVNQDGLVNLLDIGPFVDRLSSGTFQDEADVNQDGVVNLLDIEPFVDLLSG